MRQCKAVAAALLALLCCYLIACFLAWEVHPGRWAGVGRTLFAVAALGCSGVVLVWMLRRKQARNRS